MAIADLTALLDRIASPHQAPHWMHTSTSLVGARPLDLWVNAKLTPTGTGAAPTTAVVPTRATTGAIPFQTSDANALRIVGVQGSASSPNVLPGFYMLADRLSHQGGLNATTTGAQTTNLPTAAINRDDTTGLGVIAGLTIHTQIGATGTTITCSYTNEAGTAGRTTPAFTFGATGYREQHRFLPLPLQAGDLGVRSVENVNILATTGTAGAFGVTLLRPLAWFLVEPAIGGAVGEMNILNGNFAGMSEIHDDACLCMINMWPVTISATATLTLSLARDS